MAELWIVACFAHTLQKGISDGLNLLLSRFGLTLSLLVDSKILF